MLVRKCDYMTSLKQVYKEINENYKKIGAGGVEHVFETDEAWVFTPKNTEGYGSFYSAVVMKGSGETFALMPDLEMLEKYLNNSKEITVN